ncbi:hemerythrin domain-containing protein [Chloroflexota bacterium]
MEDALAIIEKIIEEHKTITEKLQNFEQVANDAEALTGFDKAKDSFMPGRLEGKKGLESFDQLLDTITEGIHGHFSREEGALMHVFEEHGDRKLSADLNSLLLEHKELRDRLASTKQDTDKLLNGQLPGQVWQALAQDMRAYVTHTRKLFEVHAAVEQKLLHTLRSELKQKSGNGGG